MLIGVVSDTHGRVDCTREAVELLETLEVEAVLHCGDIGSADVVRQFARWPTHFVFGNVDGNAAQLQAAIEAAGQTCHGRFGSIELGGRKIALLHSDDARRFDEAVHSGEWDLVCYGHTHLAKQERVGETLVLNPGALYRATPHSLAVVDLASLAATHVEVG